jgi:hypothetical protein
MGYFIRKFTPEKTPVQPLRIVEAAQALGASVSEYDSGDNWTELTVTHADGREICVIERNIRMPGELVEEEVEEFKEEVADYHPTSAANWLQRYLDGVQTIYCMQILSGSDVGNGWEVIHAVGDAISSSARCITQADNEGFSNEQGYHILWQFSDKVSGSWWMAILEEGKWWKFQMDLGNEAHRRAFKKGKVPKGLTAEELVA